MDRHGQARTDRECSVLQSAAHEDIRPQHSAGFDNDNGSDMISLPLPTNH